MHHLWAEAASWNWAGGLAGLVGLPLLVAMNGFFVAAEFALVAVRKTRIQEMVTRKVKGARSVLNAIEHLDRSIAATQLGITLASLGLGWLAESALATAFMALFSGLPAPWSWIARHSVAAGIAFFLITFLHVVFGELFPKSLALQTPTRIALWVARPLAWFELIARPIIWVMNGAGNAIVRLCGLRSSHENLVHSVEELAMLIEGTEEAGILDPQHAQLVQNVFRLSNKQVKDCLVPRDKMAALELTASQEKILEAVRNGAHTRMPVYDTAFDNVVGIVNTKDLFYLFSLQGVVVLEDAIYPALFLKPEIEIANALRLFKKAKRPMALVRADDGKILGLITLEDILEEIVGDIEDEHDRPTPRVARSVLSKLRHRALKK